MKNIFIILIVCSPSIGTSQAFSAKAEATKIQIPFEQKLSGESNSIQLKVRLGEPLSSTSQPINLIVGKNSNGANKHNEVRTIKDLATGDQLEPEYEASTPKYYSLVIGINDYQFNNDRLHDLNKAAADATMLYQTLTNNFSFQKEHSSLLINPSRKELLQQFEKLASTITPKDNLLIFYAGHGVWDEKIKVGYWLPSDAKTDDKSYWISNSTIRDYIAGIVSKHTLLITDACFGGSIFQTRDMDLTDIGMSSLYRMPSRKAMTSGTLSTVPDESKFMQYFIKRLLDTEGKYISARQLFYGLETAVLNNTTTVPQFGVIQDTGDEGGEFIFIRKQTK